MTRVASAGTTSPGPPMKGPFPRPKRHHRRFVQNSSKKYGPATISKTDGSCRACSFPMTKAEVVPSDDGSAPSLVCNTCGSSWSLGDGSVRQWLPGNGPAQFLSKQLNKNKEPERINLLKTRESLSGRIYVRLPDGTLQVTKSAADRAEELSTFASVKAAQEKAKAAFLDNK